MSRSGHRGKLLPLASIPMMMMKQHTMNGRRHALSPACLGVLMR